MTRLFVLILFLATAPDLFGTGARAAGDEPATGPASGAAHQSSWIALGD